jgi:hypothetical protein
MLLLSGGGTEAFVLMPVTFDVSSYLPLPYPSWEIEILTDIESTSGRPGEVQYTQRNSYHPFEL